MAAKSIAVVGPTASGKTRRAVEIAREFKGEIISADSRQVYRDMSIGTGKDIEEYSGINYHLIDIVDAGEKYNLHRFLSDFRTAYSDIESRGIMPVICGGSGMYVENALAGVILPEVPENPQLRTRLENLSLSELSEILASYKALHNTTDIDTPKRAIRAIEIQEYYINHPEECKSISTRTSNPLDCLVIGIDIDRESRRERITARLHSRLEEGMIDEVRKLLDSGIKPEDLIYYGLEYKFVTLYLIGELSYDKMVNDLEIAIHQFAKRQMTWFRGMEKRGIKINWLPYNLSADEFMSSVKALIKAQEK
ncbi:MAG: tRNA (adenosine(37)-N6)-dimethylallyltransferase MiaA [Bacteroidales bacterium]|nr:tRNA (adenosine(37)-N6)-dimethylallyltransferase MiaA [Bacteroidales bacterium]MBD5223280.1 tRNA (adenosine(37)-N6)-dimethylallyltransferase MiaA [Bacteroidales bacterium]